MTSDKTVRVCVPIRQETLSELERNARMAESAADLIELRLDYLNPVETQDLDHNLASLLRSLNCPSIITMRSAEEGGHRDLSADFRVSFWTSQAIHTEARWWDLEATFLPQLQFQPDWTRIICSYHDFTGVPADLETIYEQLATTEARIVKVAVQAHDVIDCLPVFKLLERARRDGREIIAIAMGNAGIATRILGPSRGSYLTYAPIEVDRATAPGQVSADTLRTVYRIDQISEETIVCGLVGFPIMHSVSPHMHNIAFDSERLNGVYIPFEVRDVGEFCKRMVHPRTREFEWRLRGLSVTAPHKLTVMKCLDWIDEHAREVGAVNTVVVEDDKLLGYNTDTAGLLQPLLNKVGSLAGIKVAVLGAGGVARAAVWALQKNGAVVTVFARDPQKAQSLAAQFAVSASELVAANFADYDVVINATPLGTFGELVNETPATAQQLQGARLVYDLVYNPVDTKLLHEARSAGCEILEGLQMLVAQAVEQFKLWTGRTPSSSLMYDRASRALQ